MAQAQQTANQQPQQQAQQCAEQQPQQVAPIPVGLYPIPVSTSERIDLLLPDLIDLLNEPEDVSKDATNPAFARNGGGGKYATLEATLGVIRPLCALHSLALFQAVVPGSQPNLVAVQSLLLHKSGQWVGMLLELPITKADAQGVGAGITYARRYAALALTGRAPMDDDGEATKGREGARTTTTPPSSQAATQAATSAVTQAAQAAAAEVIAPDQVAIVRDLCKQANVPEATVLKAAGARRFEDMTPAMYNRSVTRLQLTIKQAGEPKAAAGK